MFSWHDWITWITSIEQFYKKAVEQSLCAVSGKTFPKESALTVFVQKKPIALSIGRINIDSMETKAVVKRTIYITLIRASAFVSKLKVMSCCLRLTVLVEKDVRLQKSDLSSKYERHL